jgi:hypothetical protein
LPGGDNGGGTDAQAARRSAVANVTSAAPMARRAGICKMAIIGVGG